MDNLQEEVNECKKDILKIQEVTQRIYNELQSAWDEIDKLKKNESELQDELQSALDEIDKLKNETSYFFFKLMGTTVPTRTRAPLGYSRFM